MQKPYLAVLDFGGQLADVIRNRFEDLGFNARLFPYDTPASDIEDAAGIILSGGAKGVYETDAPKCAPNILALPVPKLGICYGFGLGAQLYGGGFHRRTREYGETRMTILQDDPLFENVELETTVWMNHGDSIDRNGCYDVMAKTEEGVPAVIRYNNFWGVQFHPEATHTQSGKQIFSNFADLCSLTSKTQAAEEFEAGKFVEEALYTLREEVGNKTAVVLASGGVDSSVVAKLCLMAGVKTVPIYLEMGNGRKGEAAYVQRTLGESLGIDVKIHDKSERFLKELAGIHDPQAKRKSFSRTYANIGLELMKSYGMDDGMAVLAQGTLATDLRESGKEAGKKGEDRGTADVIKTHHNTEAEELWKGVPKVTPLSMLTKDRSRLVARTIGFGSQISERQPFPGPGLYIRFIAGSYPIDSQLAESVRQTASRYSFSGVVLPRKGVGLKGDGRAFEHAALMSGSRDWKAARRGAKEMINKLDVCRVLYLPQEIPLDQERFSDSHNYRLERKNLDVLREATEVVERTMDDYEVHAAQVPVIMFSGPEDRPIFVIRDVDSKDFRTCRPLQKPDEFPWEAYDAIVARAKENPLIPPGTFVFDLSDKPGGTTEWE
ncbi:MAG: hypothetical protein HY513_05350 [Candidatus Aenigmarchaeota archaeon]|nr:hypothetical protein [Candidatus Aenigmarchaeota archaeon]